MAWKKTALSFIAAGLVAGFSYEQLEISNKPPKKECETYQGYKRDSQDGLQFVFDPKTVLERTSAPRITASGNSKLADYLEIGRRYCFTIREPLGFWGNASIDSAKPDRTYAGHNIEANLE